MPDENKTAEARKCPVCGNVMELRAITGVIVNVCNEHGIWLDAAELEKIKSLDRRRVRSINRCRDKFSRRQARPPGAIWGIWSLFSE